MTPKIANPNHFEVCFSTPNPSWLEWEGKTYGDKGNTLEQTVDGTILSLKQKGFASEEALAHAEGGWTMVLQNLKELPESL